MVDFATIKNRNHGRRNQIDTYLDDETFTRFTAICEQHELKYSPVVAALIEEFLETEEHHG